jgi:inner membrane protein involved in colicin E2 resistance
MRYRRKNTVAIGEKRTVEKFLWLPKTLKIHGTMEREFRWLERVKIVQFGVSDLDLYWRPITRFQDMWWA